METELERMVVRLTGDSAEYTRMLQQAQQETRETAQVVEQQSKTIEGFGTALKGFAAGAVSYLGSLGIKQWLADTLGAYKEQEKAEKQLGIILGVNGRDVEKQMDRYKDWATQMQALTGAADEVTLSMLKQAEAMGVTGANAERAVRNVIAAEAAGMHIGIRQAAMLEQGHLGRLARQLGDLGGGSEQQKIAVAQERLTKMFAIAEEEGKKTAVQLRVAWNELWEDFGKAVKKVMQPVNEVKLAVVNWFRSLSDGSKQAIVVLASVAASVLAVAAAISLAGTVFNTMFGGVGLIVGVIVTAGAASAYWLSTFESIGAAWDYIKEKGGAAWAYIKGKASELWDFLRPAWLATQGVLSAGWDLIKQAASIAWEFIRSAAIWAYTAIVEAWRRFFGEWSINWEQGRLNFMVVMIKLEFGLRNLQRVGTLAFDMLRLSFHIWMEEMKHGLANMFSTETSERVITDFERQLTASVTRRLEKMGRAYHEFEAERLREYFATPAQLAEIERAGTQEEAARNAGKKKEAEKFEAAARYSAEATSRIYAFFERQRPENRSTAAQLPGVTGSARIYTPSEGGIDVVARGQETANRLLTRVANATEQANLRPQINLEEVDLE